MKKAQWYAVRIYAAPTFKGYRVLATERGDVANLIQMARTLHGSECGISVTPILPR